MLDQRWKQQLNVIVKALPVGSSKPWPGFGEPFNGQATRLRSIRNLVASFSPDAFVETGTFLGHTTQFFSGNGVPVYTAEVKLPVYLAARMRLAFAPDVTVMRADSSKAISDLAARRPFERPLAYLDAHWWRDLPLPQEVATILGTWNEALIVIDDMKVPDDPGYGYDMFEGQPLSIDMLNLTNGTVAAYPAVSSSDETGGRRGTLYLAQGPDAVSALDGQVSEGLLRRADGAARGS
jgi:hypothetical protein